MDDTIYRQDAFDALNGLTKIFLNNLPPTIDRADAVDAIKALPSAQLAQDLTNGCTDTISRQAAIQTAKRMYKRCDTGSIADYHDLMVDALTELPPAQSRWIPCSRELPKPNEEDGNGFHKAYLVQDGRWMDVARWDGKYWIAWGYSTVLLNVVAWMPLPTPYREGGQE